MTPSEIARMFSRISTRYDLANHVISLGRDRSWRRRLVRQAACGPQERILDICTGTADLLIEFARLEESLTLWGLDLSRRMLSLAGKKLRQNGCAQRALLLEGDALKLPFPSGIFDVVAIAFGLRNLVDLGAGLAEMTRVLRPKGRLLVLEFSLPASPLLRRPYLLYLKHIVPALGGLIAGDRAAYEYLHRSIREFPSSEEILQKLRLCGLERVEFSPLTGGIAAIYRGERL